MPVFTNQENKAFVLRKAGDYPFQVVGMESGLQTGTGKTAGCPYWEMKLKIDDAEGGTVFKRLIDHPSCNWMIDTFLKSAGVEVTEGTAFEFVEDTAESSGCLWIDPIGLRGWFHLGVEEYDSKKSGQKEKRNSVLSFLTDRPKRPRVGQSAPASAPSVDSGDDDFPV
jgi:hypothetical protein